MPLEPILEVEPIRPEERVPETPPSPVTVEQPPPTAAPPPAAAVVPVEPAIPIAPAVTEMPSYVRPAPVPLPEEVVRASRIGNVLPGEAITPGDVQAITHGYAGTSGLEGKLLYAPTIEDLPNRLRNTLLRNGEAESAQLVIDNDMGQTWTIGNRFGNVDELHRGMIEEAIPRIYAGIGDVGTIHDPGDRRLGWFDNTRDAAVLNTAQLINRPNPLGEGLATASHELVGHQGFGILFKDDPEGYTDFLNGFRRVMDSKGMTDELAMFKGFGDVKDFAQAYKTDPASQTMNEELLATYVEKNFPTRRDFENAPSWFTAGLNQLADSIRGRTGMNLSEWTINEMVRDSYGALRDFKSKLGVGARPTDPASLRGDQEIYPRTDIVPTDEPARANAAQLELGRSATHPELNAMYDRLEGAGLPVAIVNSPRGPVFLNYGETKGFTNAEFGRRVAEATADSIGSGQVLAFARNRGTFNTYSAEPVRAARGAEPGARLPGQYDARGAGAERGGLPPTARAESGAYGGAGIRRNSTSNPGTDIRVDASGRFVDSDSNAPWRTQEQRYREADASLTHPELSGYPASIRGDVPHNGDQPEFRFEPAVSGSRAEGAGEPVRPGTGERTGPVPQGAEPAAGVRAGTGAAATPPTPGAPGVATIGPGSAREQLIRAQLERTRAAAGERERISQTAEQRAAGRTGEPFGARMQAAGQEALYTVRPRTAAEDEARALYDGPLERNPDRAFEHLNANADLAKTDTGQLLAKIAGDDLKRNIQRLDANGAYDAARTVQHSLEKLMLTFQRVGGDIARALGSRAMMYQTAESMWARVQGRFNVRQVRKLASQPGKRASVDGAYDALSKARAQLVGEALDKAKPQIDKLQDQVGDKPNIYHRFLAAVADGVDREIARAGVTPQEVGPLQRFTNLLRSSFVQLAREGGTLPENIRQAPISTATKLGDILTHWGLADSAWRTTVEKLRLENPNAIFINSLNRILDTPFSEAQVAQLAREAGVNIRKLAQQHYSLIDRTSNILAQGLIRDAGLSEGDAFHIQSIMDRYVNGIVRASQESQVAQIMARTETPTVRVKQGELDNLMKMMNIGMLDKEQYYNAIADRFGLPSWDDQMVTNIRNVGNQMQRIQAEAGPRFLVDRLAGQIADELFKAEPDWTRIGARWEATWMANLLTGPMTHGPYWMQTSFQTVLNANINNLMGVYRGELKGDVLVKSMQDLWRGLPHAGRDFMQTLLSGVRPMRDVPPEGMASMMGLGDIPFRNPLESAPFTGALRPLNAYKWVPRFLDAMESFFYRSGQYAAIRGTAIRLAQEHGMAYEDALKWSEDAITGTDEARAKAVEQADRERTQYNLTDEAFNRRLDELNQLHRAAIVDSEGRPIGRELVDALNRFSLHSTYREAAGGLAGRIGRAIRATETASPLIKQIMPFVNLPANVANEVLAWTPLGYMRAKNLEGFYRDVPGMNFDRLSATEIQTMHDEFLFKSLVGSTFLGTALVYTYLNHDDPNAPIQFHGEGPADPGENRMWRAAGNIPYSVKVGDFSVPFEASPFKAVVGAIGGLNDLLRYDKIKPGNGVVDGTMAVLFGAIGPTLQASYLQGLQNFMEAVSSRGMGTKEQRLSDWVSSQAGTYLTIPMFGTAARQIQKAVDPTVFESKGFFSNLIRNMPLVNNALLSPRLNSLGDPVTASSWQRFLAVQNPDPIYRFIGDHDIRVALPDPRATHMPSGATMNPDQFELYVQRRGTYIKDYLLRAMQIPAFAALPKAQMDEQMRQVETDAGAQAKYDVVRRFGYGEPTPRRQRPGLLVPIRGQ